jgi:hypothetical protein
VKGSGELAGPLLARHAVQHEGRARAEAEDLAVSGAQGLSAMTTPGPRPARGHLP